MTSTLTRHATQPPGGGNLSANGSVSNGSVSEADTPPSHVTLNLTLPDGRTSQITVEYGKQMMDLIVQVAASHKYSPAGYTLVAVSEETGRPVQYQASQSIGSLGVTDVELISKKAEKERRSQPAVKPLPGFQKTQRLTVSLPRNQKFVTRVNYKDSLAAIFRMVCQEKNLDPYKYELRHPTHPDEPLNMATPLDHYGIHEICVVSVSAQDARRAADYGAYDATDYNVTTQRSVVTSSSSATLPADMPRRKPENEATSAYMPGMTEKKKKKGFLGLFSKKKEGKFQLDGATYGESSTSGSSGAPSASSTMTRSVSASVAPAHAAQQSSTATFPRSQSHGVAMAAATGGASAASAPKQPSKPPRSKRKAPAPPPPPGAATAAGARVSASESLTVSVTNEQTKEHHSRNSSHSSGFDETNVSPLESPGNSSRESTKTQESSKTKTSIDASSIDSSEMVHKVPSSTVKADIPAPIAESTTSLKRKKRRAPPPPPPGAAASVATSSAMAAAHADDDDFPPPPPPEEFASSTDDNKPKRDSNEGLEDVADLVNDALKRKEDGDSDSSSVSSAVIDDAIRSDDGSAALNVRRNLTDEVALPDNSDPALVSHRLSDSDGHVITNGDGHVTTISVGRGYEPSHIERQESIEKARHASQSEDPRLSLRMDEEITLGHDEIMYVDPDQPRSRTGSKSSDPRRSRTLSDSSSIHSEGGFGADNVLTEEDRRRFENDYRMPKRQKEEIVEFKFGTLDRNKTNFPLKKEEPKPVEAPVTSLRSLRQAYTRNRPAISTEESGMAELNKKPLFVYTGSDVDREEQAALYQALKPAADAPTYREESLGPGGDGPGYTADIPEPAGVYTGSVGVGAGEPAAEDVFAPAPQSPRSPTIPIPRDAVELMHERRLSSGSTPPSSPRRFSAHESEPLVEEETILSPVETLSPDPVLDPVQQRMEELRQDPVEQRMEEIRQQERNIEPRHTQEPHREEFVIPKEEMESMRPRLSSGGAAAARASSYGTSFVQSAAYREHPPAASTGRSAQDPIKQRSSKPSIYDIIKADISQRKGGIHHHVTDTYDDVAEAEPPTAAQDDTAHSPQPGEMDYLEYDNRSKRMSGGVSAQEQEVVLPKQQFFFSSTSVADEYTPPVVRHEAKTTKPSRLLMGPRPFVAHRGSSSESNRDTYNSAEYSAKDPVGTDHNSNYTTTEAYSARTTSSFHSDNMTVPQSPKRSEGTGARSELGFSPRPESESDSILEEKPISMIALPTVKSQSASSYSAGRRGSHGDAEEEDERSARLGDQSNLKSTGDLSQTDVNEKYENSKHSLQTQYDKLQEQFHRWQGQLAENQELLSRKKILPPSRTSSTSEQNGPTSPTNTETTTTSSSNRFNSRSTKTAPSAPQRNSSIGSGGGQPGQSRFSSQTSNSASSHAYTPGSFSMGSASTARGGANGTTGYSSRYSDTGLKSVEPNTSVPKPPSPVVRSASSSSSALASAINRQYSGSGATSPGFSSGSSGGWKGSGARSSVVHQEEPKVVQPPPKAAQPPPKFVQPLPPKVAHLPPSGRKSTAELVRQPMRKGRNFSSQSSNESTGPANKPGIGDLLAAKSRLRKGSSEFSPGEMSEGITEATPPPPALPASSPPKTPPHHNLSMSFTDTPKEGSPGSSPAGGRLGSRSSYGSSSSYSSITPTTPKPPPPPTAQPIKSALKQPKRGGAKKDDPRFGPKLDPREELMIAIRNAGGRNALNKEENE